MTANELGNAADDAIGRKGTRADRGAGAGAAFSRSALARIWRGQEQLRQKMLTANSTGASRRNT